MARPKPLPVNMLPNKRRRKNGGKVNKSKK